MFSGVMEMFSHVANQSVYLLPLAKCKLLFIGGGNGQRVYII